MSCTAIKNKIPNPNVSYVVIDDTEGKLEMGVFSTDRRVTVLVDEQIASFTELAAKHGDIDKKCAKKIRKKVYHVLTALQSREPPSLEQMQQLYQILYSLIEKTISRAQLNGKKALIVGLENHIDRKSLFLELMIIDIANRLGIKNLMPEVNYEFLEDPKQESLDSILTSNIPFFLKLAKEYEFKILPCDPHAFECEEFRRVGINQSILKSNENSVIFIGANHLMHISLDKNIHQMYEVLNINASNIGGSIINNLFKNPNFRRDELDFALNPDHAQQVNVPGNPYSFDVAEMRHIIDSVRGSAIIMGPHLYEDGMWDETRFSSPDALPVSGVESEVESAKVKERELKVMRKLAELATRSQGVPQHTRIPDFESAIRKANDQWDAKFRGGLSDYPSFRKDMETGEVGFLPSSGRFTPSSLATGPSDYDDFRSHSRRITSIIRRELDAGFWADLERRINPAQDLVTEHLGSISDLDLRLHGGRTPSFLAIGPNSNLNLSEDEDVEPSEESASLIFEEGDIDEMGAGDQSTPVGFRTMETVD